MNPLVLNALTRRASLVTLGGTAPAVLVSPLATAAKKNDVNKKAKKKCRT